MIADPIRIEDLEAVAELSRGQGKPVRLRIIRDLLGVGLPMGIMILEAIQLGELADQWVKEGKLPK